MAIPELFKILGQSNPGPVATILYQVPAAKVAMASKLLVSNIGNLDRTFRVTVNAAGGAGQASPQFVAFDVTISPGDQYELLSNVPLQAAATVVVYGSSIDVTFNLFGFEMAIPAGEALKILAQGNPGAVATALYAVPAGKATVISKLILHNTSAAARTYRVAVNAGGGAGQAGASLVAYEVPILGKEVHEMLAGATLQAAASVAIYSSGNEVNFNLFGSEVTP